MIFINPKVISTSGEQCGEEGCLSFPGLFLEVTRPNRVFCKYTDIDGHEQTISGEGLLARAILHEIDHLDGVLFIDHLEPADKEMIAGKLRKMKVS